MREGLAAAICKDLVSIISPAVAGYAVGKKWVMDPVLTSSLIGGPLVVLSGFELLSAHCQKKAAGDLLLPQNSELRIKITGKAELTPEDSSRLATFYSTNYLYEEAGKIIAKKTVGTGLSFGLGYLASNFF
jgi:hypothetical protein